MVGARGEVQGQLSLLLVLILLFQVVASGAESVVALIVSAALGLCLACALQLDAELAHHDVICLVHILKVEN